MTQPPTMFPRGVQNKNANDAETSETPNSTTSSTAFKAAAQPSPFTRPADGQATRPGLNTTQAAQQQASAKPTSFQRPADPATPPARSSLGLGTSATRPATGLSLPNQTTGLPGANRPYVGQSGLGQPNLGQSTWTSPLRQTGQAPASAPTSFADRDAASQKTFAGAQSGTTLPTGSSGLFKPAGATTFQNGANTAPQGAPPPRPSLFRSQPTEALRQPISPSSAFRAPTPAAVNTKAASPFRKDLQISDEEFLQLRDFIYQQCGIFIAENRKYLVENRLSNRIKDLNLKSYNEYYNFLRFDASRKTELSKLFEVVTTNETSFFRNPPQLEVFQKNVLPEILDRCRQKGQKKLRIWSAGCSTGEEPYTLAIILHEVLRGEISSWDIKITANDLSEAVLSAARRGIYSEYALRTTPKPIVDAYFVKEDNIYKIKPELKNLISFGQINLSDKEQLKRVEKSQIVFCRNVIIYFDDEMKRKVINAFYDNLEVNGALLIGHSESLHNISRAFQLEHFKGTIVYRKLV